MYSSGMDQALQTKYQVSTNFNDYQGSVKSED